MPRKNVATSYTGVNGKFRPGNPGRPKGARHRTTLAIEAILDGEAEALTRTAIELAKAGDTTAAPVPGTPGAASKRPAGETDDAALGTARRCDDRHRSTPPGRRHWRADTERG
jgi:hypothetical protein